MRLMSRIATQRMILVAVTLAIALVGTSAAFAEEGPNADVTIRGEASLACAGKGDGCDLGMGIAGFTIHWAR